MQRKSSRHDFRYRVPDQTVHAAPRLICNLLNRVETMHQIPTALVSIVACFMLSLPHLASAQTTPAIPAAITTPDKMETRIGTLDFKDGVPSKETIAKVYDNLEFTHAFNAFVNTTRP